MNAILIVGGIVGVSVLLLLLVQLALRFVRGHGDGYAGGHDSGTSGWWFDGGGDCGSDGGGGDGGGCGGGD